jgi:hypothetical protein
VNSMGWNSLMRSDLSTPLRLSNSNPIKASSASASVCAWNACSACITSSPTRACPALLRQTFPEPLFLSLTLYRASTVRLVKQCKAILDQIQQGEVSGILSAEEKKRLEEQVTEKGIQVLFNVRLSSYRIFSFSIQMPTHVVNKKNSAQ